MRLARLAADARFLLPLGLWVLLGAPHARAGDPEAGRAVFIDRERGHCLLCHQVQQLDAPFQGNIGPDLSNVGARLDARMLRDRVTDPTRFNPDTAMPAYHRSDGLNQVMTRYADQPVLDAQELDDLVAYLLTLTTSGE
ncbi:MAG: sulfur oxidation c-type cytochrome SoxX [Pseudomonadota bacterium]